MKLSEAIILGSSIVTSEPGKIFNPDTASGCALGMAAMAAGLQVGDYPLDSKSTPRTGNIECVWPWTRNLTQRPCWCIFLPRKMTAATLITHLFDKHVHGRRNWTLDDLARWIHSIEPHPPERSATIQPSERLRVVQYLQFHTD